MGIMVNKGRIYGKLGNFFRYLWNSIKSNNELRLEIRKFIILRKITQLRIHDIKNQAIWIRIIEKSKIENERKFDHKTWLKTKINLKFNLIYDSKCKSNAKWWKIKMKTHNLTKSGAQNDSINRRIYGYSFRNFKDEDGIQDVISPYFFDEILISNTSQTRKWVKKLKKSKDSQIVVSRQFDLLKKSKNSFLSRRTIQFICEFGRHCRMRRSIETNG